MKSVKKRFQGLSVVLAVLTVLVFSGTSAFAGVITWDKTFGGSDGDDAESIIQTSDGGYIVAGDTESKGAGGKDAWVIKLDKYGNKKWDKTFGGKDFDGANSITQTSDGGYIVAGDTNSKGAGEYDAWVIKLDKNGNTEWDKTFGGSSYDEAESIIQTSDGGYIVAGFTGSKGAGSWDTWVIKLDKNGNKEWDKTFGGSDSDGANSIAQTSDGGYIVAGWTGDDVWVIKLDKNGNKEWDKTFGGSDKDEAYSIVQTSDGGYIVAGYTDSKGGDDDAWVIKLDKNGNEEWDKTFGGNFLDDANSIAQTSDGGYIVAGYTRSKGAGGDDAWVIKLDKNGNKKWDKTFGGSDWDKANSVIQTSDGGYIVAGDTESKGAGGDDAWVIKLDKNGNLRGEK